ncbi:MAG TPA: plastocyanin/azurin family copper-binding protein [Rhodanobacteraceae bacterium]|jgi:plastocyanin|nr:plastocyanin/azurin family copper-binding protein [Rhodanobacteraceae bacterium]
MNTRLSFLGVTALLLLCAGSVGAKEWEVDAENNLTFNPPTLTINAGDTVIFKNMGGQHNVQADDGSFKCAQGCSDTGGSGNPSGALWSFTRTFNTPGTIRYYCINHGAPGGIGMAGSITVNATAAAFTVRPGLSGNWSDPTANQAGHGFQFEILPNNSMLAIWFVFTPDGSGQTWLFAQGTYDPASDTVTLPTYLSLGAKFPPNFTHADDIVTQWGTMTFKFTDCNNGTMNWNSTTAGYPPTGNLPISRVTTIAGLACP